DAFRMKSLRPLPVGDGIAGLAVAEGQPAWTDDILKDRAIYLSTEIQAETARATHRSVMAAPMLVNGVARGALVGHSRAVGAFSTADADGSSALALLQAAAATPKPYSLAILDTQMPGMDGLTLARTIRRNPHLSSLPLVLLTWVGMHGRERVDQSFEIAVALPKPIRQSQ